MRWRLLPSSLALLVLTGCTAREAVAVSGSASEVIVHVARCDADERVVEVKIATVGRDKIPDNRDDQVVWDALSSSGVAVDSVVAGNPPTGFVEKVPLSGPLEPHAEYYALVDSGVCGTHAFRPDQLREDRVLYEGRLRTLAAFTKSARSGGKCSKSVPTSQVVARSVGLCLFIAVTILLVRRLRRGNPSARA